MGSLLAVTLGGGSSSTVNNMIFGGEVWRNRGQGGGKHL